METMSSGCICSFLQINWLWYAASVIVVYAVGAIWYGKLFTNSWLKSVRYKCLCGAELDKGEKCTCQSRSMWPMLYQFAATILIGLMYFVLTALSIWLALLVAVAISGWMKATLKFQIPEWKRFVTLASIDVGYFFLSSLIFMGFASI